MARVNFNDAVESSKNDFFKLEDKEVARVQFLISSVEDIPTFYTHNVQVEGMQYGKHVQCNRTDYEDSECEFCKAGIKRQVVAVVLMYDLDTKSIKIWQRGKKFVSDKIVPLLNRYGDLRKLVVEIERQGKGLQTNYSLFAMPQDDPEDVSELDIPQDFDFMLWNKSNDDMRTYLDTGVFPQASTESREEQPTRRSREEQPSRRSRRF